MSERETGWLNDRLRLEREKLEQERREHFHPLLAEDIDRLRLERE